MIYEYAFDPQLLLELANDKQSARFFLSNMGLGTPRVLARFPDDWKEYVKKIIDSSKEEVNKRNLELIHRRLMKVSTKRTHSKWDGEVSWLDNVDLAHSDSPFRAIISTSNPKGKDGLLVASEIDDFETDLWKTETSVVVDRDSETMSEIVGPMLKICDKVAFIDPYFDPGTKETRKPIEFFLKKMMEGRKRNPSLVEVHTLAEDRATREHFVKKCEEEMRRRIPHMLKVNFRRWFNKENGQKFHNRYILTDIGGVIFGHGLGEGRSGETDDVLLLGEENYLKRWNQYMGQAPAFREEEQGPISILGFPP